MQEASLEKNEEVENAPGTRQKLLDAARVALLEKGHIKTTVKEIAATAGVNHGLVHHYFRSKEHLFVELIKENPVYLESVLPPEDQDAVITYLMDNLFPNTRLYVEFHSLAQDMPEVQEALRKVLNSKRAEVQKRLGLADSKIATLVIAMIGGLVLHYNLDKSIPVKDVLKALFELLKTGESQSEQPVVSPESSSDPQI